MGKTASRVVLLFLVAVLGGIALPMDVLGQVFTDGPIQLQARLRRFNLTFPETDVAFFGVVGQPDDMTYFVWMRDAADLDNVTNPSWGPGSGCLTENYTLPLTDWNLTLFNYTYPTNTVPQFLQVRSDFWEDESPDQLLGIGCGGTRCAYDLNFCCGGFLFGLCLGAYDDDDLRCNSGTTTPYATLNYRLGPPCQWYDHGFTGGTCANNIYNPRFETFWRYTRGENCGNAIDLGILNPGFTPVSHFNSNECYINDIAYPGGGNDVVYQITVNQPVGLVFNTCGVGSLVSDVLVLNSGCNIIYQNSGGCGSGSQVAQAFCTPGIYYVVVEGRAGSLGTFTLSITENPALIVAASAGPNVAVCSGLGVTIGAQLPTLPATGGMPGYTYNWSPNTFITSTTDSITTVFPPFTTDYILEVQDALGCIDRDTVTVTVNPGPVVNLGPNQTVCPGTSVNFNAGPGFTSYFWSTGAFTQSITTSTPGQYIAVAADLNGCLGRDTVTLANFATPVVNLGNDTSICIGNNIQFNAGPGFSSYSWSTGGAGQTIIANTAGNYHVTVQDGNGCVNRDTVFLGIDTLPIPSLPAAVSICPGGTAVLNPGAGWPTYSWSNGTINQINITSQTGSHTVTVTDGNGCVGTASTNVAVSNPPAGFNVTAPSNFICQGQSINISAGTGPAIAGYLWNTGATTSSVTASTPGWYEVTVTDLLGCEWLDSILINQLPNPAVNLGPDTNLCQGNVLVLLAPSGLTYNWSTGSSSQSIIVNTAGTYSVTVTNSGTTCFATDQVVVGVVPNPAPALAAGYNFCPGASVTLDPGPGFTSYSWNTGSNSQSINVSIPGNYFVTVTNANGCVGTAGTSVSQFNSFTASITGNVQACAGTTETLTATPGMTSYAWSIGGTGQSITVNGSGTYTVTVTDANGCEATASHTITFNPPPTVGITPPSDTLCAGATATLDAGAGFSVYQWSTGSGAQTITVGQTGTYSVTVTDANNCSASATMNLVGSTVAPVNLGPDINICDSGSVLIDAGPEYVQYTWTPMASANQYIIVQQSGTYNVTVTDQYGCTSSDAIVVTTNAITPQDFMVDDTAVCAGQFLLIDAGDQWVEYEWSTGSPDQYLLVEVAGTYTVTVTDPDGCRYSDSVTVTTQTPPDLELGANVNLCPGEVLTLDAGSGYDTYMWSNGATTQTISTDAPGEFAVTVTFNICTLEDAVLVGDDCPGNIFIPNVFSPNDDNLNDFFRIDHLNLEWLTVGIYDRWGKYVYNSADKNFQWDGTYKGNPLPEGVYYFVCEYKLNNDANTYEKKGTVTLLR